MTAPATSQSLRISPSLRLMERRWLVWLGDSLIAFLCAAIALWLWSFSDPVSSLATFFAQRWNWLMALPCLWLSISFAFFNLHRTPHPRYARREVMGTGLVSLFLYVGIFFVAQPHPLPRLVVVYYLALTMGATLAWRAGFVRLFSLPALQRRLLVVGAGRAGRAIVEALQDESNTLYTLVGVVDDDDAKHGEIIEGVRVLGGSAQLEQAVEAFDVSDVVLAISGDLTAQTFQALLECQARGLPLIRMSTLYEEITGRVPLDHLDPQWLSGPTVENELEHLVFFAVKRVLDVVGALIGLAVLAVIFPVVAAAIWLEDGGGVFYRQVRLGRNGRPFSIAKLRTMVPDAENGRAQWAVENDDRVTRIGRFLRRTRLDETPQFWNVLRGDMSLVGPRPERPEFFTALEREQPLFRARLLVKPGISGWAQVNYGYANTLQDNIRKLQWDLYYVKHMSLWLDTAILMRTVGVVLRLKGT